MAYTVSTTAQTVFGNMRVVALRVTADAATQTIETGLKNVYFATDTPLSCTVVTTLSAGAKAGWAMYPNSNASGVQSMGVLGVSNAVSGDVKDIIVFGADL